ncbi:helix-turn-helix transcriptional regulator [Lactiplantibacillus plantarum]|uniref:helix-turn-helix transcriptional regulator n=2 Tax=Lactobacillaceae TaxID=33958 RepID=UPI0021CB6D1A|nr:helix-turn-helix transcriptional regulator [Lactiplantibacillus plantarum]
MKGAMILKLKYYREAMNLTQEELARHAKVSVAMVQSMENGRRKGSTDTILKLSDALNVTVDDLLRGNDMTISHKKEAAK